MGTVNIAGNVAELRESGRGNAKGTRDDPSGGFSSTGAERQRHDEPNRCCVVLLILFGAGRLASQEAAQVQAQDKTQGEARIRVQETPQETSLTTSGSPQQPSLKPNPLETLRNFEPAADEEYRLGKGDEITVDFAGRPDMQAKLIVGPDGRITLPLAGDVMLAGLTRLRGGQGDRIRAGELLYEPLRFR